MTKSAKRRHWSHNLTQKAIHAIVILRKRMFKKLALGFAWLAITPVLIITLGFYVASQKAASAAPKLTASINTQDIKIDNTIRGQVLGEKITDMRPILVSNFLSGTPLAPYSKNMVEVADKYDIDYRLIPAIAMKESGGGAAISEITHNAWGFENGSTKFDSWETAIDTVGKTLKNRYIAKGLTTPEQIMAVYAPPQLETGGKWAKDINLYFSQMQIL